MSRQFIKRSLIGLIIFLAMVGFSLPNHAKAEVSEDDIIKATNLLTSFQSTFVQKKISFQYQSSAFTTSYARLGVTFDLSQTLANIIADLNEGESLPDKTALLISQDQLPYSIILNETKFDGYFLTLSKLFLPLPVNATLKIVQGQVVLVPGKDGLIFDTENGLKQNIVSDITNHANQIYILQTIANPPKITDDLTTNAKLTAENWLNQTVKLRVLYNHQTRLHRANKTYIAYSIKSTWIYFVAGDTELEAKISKKAVERWLALVAKRARIEPYKNLVSYLNGHRIVVRRGYAGQKISTSNLAEEIITTLSANLNYYQAVQASLIKPGDIILGGIVPGRYRGQYIEISLSQQRMYIFKGYRLLHIYLISSGRPSMPTPTGTFRIRDKRRWNACRPSPEYWSCMMPYTMHFSGGNAIHALPIINGRQEGLWHLGIPVSHGCVRLAPAAAIHLYYTLAIGTPVIIHR
jgi:hypothetical protein